MIIIDCVPLTVFFAAIVILSALSIEVGVRLGRKRSQRESEAPIGAMITSTLGLLAFLLAFTFNIAANRFEDRRAAVLKEANAIGTAYLRADFLDQPVRDRVKADFREYVNVRVNMRGKVLSDVVSKSNVLQKKLWSETASQANEYSHSPIYALFVDSLNEVIDTHEERVAAGIYGRVPIVIWLTLITVAVLSMTGVGYICGIAGTRSWPASLILTLAFSIVMVLVADLDRPSEGIIKTGLQPLIDLSDSMDQPAVE
jgi:hypothetical protein